MALTHGTGVMSHANKVVKEATGVASIKAGILARQSFLKLLGRSDNEGEVEATGREYSGMVAKAKVEEKAVLLVAFLS